MTLIDIMSIMGNGGGTSGKVTELLDICVTPEMYGAVGDGVTDDTVAVKAALASDKPVVVLVSDYAVSDTISIGTGKTVCGNGKTIKRIAGSTADPVICIDGVHDVTLHDLKIDASCDFSYRIEDAEQYAIDRAAAKECLVVTGGAHDVLIDHVESSYGLTGYSISGGAYDIRLRDCTTRMTLADGVHLGYCWDCTVTGHFCYKCQDDAYACNTYTSAEYQPHDNGFYGCRAESCYGRGFNTSGKRITFADGQCVNGNAAPFNFETRSETAAEDCVISDSTFSTINEQSSTKLNNKNKLMITSTTSATLKAKHCRVVDTVIKSGQATDSPNILYVEGESVRFDHVTIEGYVLHIASLGARFDGCTFNLCGGITCSGSTTVLDIINSTLTAMQSAKADTDNVIKISNATCRLHGNQYTNAYSTPAVRFGGSTAKPCTVEVDTSDLVLSSGGVNSAGIESDVWMPYAIASSSNTALSDGQIVIDGSTGTAYIYAGTLKQISA